MALKLYEFDIGPCVWGQCHFSRVLRHHRASFDFFSGKSTAATSIVCSAVSDR